MKNVSDFANIKYRGYKVEVAQLASRRHNMFPTLDKLVIDLETKKLCLVT